ncbi:MAG: O-antigen ligase family protein [Chloroflexales bacterium]|nr:O-antigen ligase family protein [Chloroflexales bacterium]
MNTEKITRPEARAAAAQQNFFVTQRSTLILIGMFVGLAIFYRGSYQLPISALGLAIFSLLALMRPDLGLLFVPLTVPLFFMPKGIWDERFGIRPTGVSFPLHEIVLLVVLGATIASWLWQVVKNRAQKDEDRAASNSRGRFTFDAVRLAPIALFGLAGTIGVFIVPAEGRSVAIREWRWLIVEPLIFYALLRWHIRPSAANAQPFRSAHKPATLLDFFLAGGALVGLLGVLQFLGLNLAPLIGDKSGFSDDRIFVEGVQRVTSVYGHPNNLGLYMGRIWPLALVVLLWHWRAGNNQRRTWSLLLYAACSLLAIGGLFVSFSRGALLGAFAALLMLGLLLSPNAQAALRNLRWFLGFGLLLVVAGAVAVFLGVERFNLLSESSAIRLKTWASAWAMVREHPIFGIGLDQFGRLYPQYIDPSLVETNERFTAHPHNLLLDIWLRMGLLGMAAFAWLVGSFYYRAIAMTSAASQPGLAQYLRAGLLAVMTAALVHGLVDSFYFWPDLAFAFWLLLGLAELGDTA